MLDRIVLVVDNNQDTRRVLRLYMEVAGCDVIEAEDGETAIQQAKEHRPNLILMDLNMPNLDGFEATRRIREIEGMKEVPILILSSYIYDAEIKRRAMMEGATDCLWKPNDIVKLKTVVSKYLPPL